jgi:hypothetical protein
MRCCMSTLEFSLISCDMILTEYRPAPFKSFLLTRGDVYSVELGLFANYPGYGQRAAHSHEWLLDMFIAGYEDHGNETQFVKKK